jgi:hypothetical protein
MILSALRGVYGHAIPDLADSRVGRQSSAFVWPLMAMFWAFDPDVVHRRSWLAYPSVHASVD